jgi:hypothetical protein
MTIQIPFTPEAEAKLRRYAQAAGMDVTSFIVDVLEQKLSEAPAQANPTVGTDSLGLLERLDPGVWEGIDPIEYQRREREGWD